MNGSALKKDPRSDITCCAGVFFYLLTGIEPGVLIDENGCMPHQRDHARQELNKINNNLCIQVLSKNVMQYRKKFSSS